MRARLIANPKSGSDRASSFLPAAAERLRTLVTDLDITLTTGEHDIERAAIRAVDEGCNLLFVAGGDGTVNIAVRAVAAIPGGLDRITFGVLPLGTGNDFAKALDLGEVASDALEVLLDGQVIDADLGVLNDRTFVNISAGGFVADVSTSLSEPLKDVAGKLSYVIGGVRALFGREPFATTVLVDGSPPFPAALDLQMFTVCNARFIGGGYPIAPAALIDDGRLDVLLVKQTTTLESVALMPKIAAGDHLSDPRVVHFRAAELELAVDRAINVNTDGEALQADRCRYTVRHRAARFLCGPHPQADAAPRPLMV